LGLKNTVEAYLNEAGQYLKLKAQLENRTPTVEVQNLRVALLDKLGQARDTMEKLEAQFIRQLVLLPKLISEGSYLRLRLSKQKQMNGSCVAK